MKKFPTSSWPLRVRKRGVLHSLDRPQIPEDLRILVLLRVFNPDS
jgi:hypothetical protein